MKFFSFLTNYSIKGSLPGLSLLLAFYMFTADQHVSAQNVFSGEPVQWVGRPNGYSTEPYNSDYRTTGYRKISTTVSNPSDGRGQWSTTINVQTSGGNITPDNMPGGPGAGWLLISGPSGGRFNNKWNFTGIGQGAVNAINDMTLEGGGQDMGLNMGTAGYYIFNMRDAGYTNSECFIGYTAGVPVNVSRASQVLNSVTNGETINITTNATPSSENIYVRYRASANDFTSGTTIIQATGSGTSWSAEIPAQACGTTVYYYVFTSTRSLSQLTAHTEQQRSLCAIRYDDSFGSNFNYTSNTVLVTVTPGTNGSISPGTGTATCSSSPAYTITPNSCYSRATVLIDGVNDPAAVSTGTYTFNNLTGNHTISATFSLNTYEVNASAGANGSITPAGITNVNCGANQTYTITADACYSIADVVVDGVSQGAVGTYTFTNVTANHTISATFVLNTYTITVTAGANGSITPATGSVHCGDNATYTITANSCYSIADVVVDGVSQGAVGTYSFTNVTANHTISASFVQNSYSINVNNLAPDYVGISPGNSTVGCGNNITFNFTTDPDYSCYGANITVDGVQLGIMTSYTFTNVTADHTLSVGFVQKTYTITASAGPGGSISNPGVATVLCGNFLNYTITPNPCYSIANVVVDGVPQGPVGNYLFEGTEGDHTISASFVLSPPLTAPVVTGPVNVCPYLGTGEQVTYTFNSVGATGYSFILPPNMNQISATANSVTVTFNAAFGPQANKQIKVTALSTCGNSPQTIYYLLSQLPNLPGPISGPTNVCPLIGTGNYTYSVSPVLGATSYLWASGTGATISYPNGTGINSNSISVSFDNSFATSGLTVRAVNGCGTSSPRSLNILRSNPAQPGLISGPTNVCANIAPGGTLANYTVGATTGVATYTWGIPAGALNITGQGTNTISFTYPAGYTGGTITVVNSNGCGSSTARSLAVSRLNPGAPGRIDVVSLEEQGHPCPDRQYSFTIAGGTPSNATSIVWTVPSGATIASQSPPGLLPTSINVSFPNATDSVVTVQAFNNCGAGTKRTAPIKLGTCEVGKLLAKGGQVTSPAANMTVHVFPNPTISDFKLQVITAGKEAIRVRIVDMEGREIKSLTVMPYQVMTIGSDLKAGVYMLEVTQGDVVRTTKLLKF